MNEYLYNECQECGLKFRIQIISGKIDLLKDHHEIHGVECLENQLKQEKAESSIISSHSIYSECLINDVENDFVFVSTEDEDEEPEFLKIPCEELQKVNIQCKPGVIFVMRRKESTIFEPIERPHMTDEDIAKLSKSYDKYKDV